MPSLFRIGGYLVFFWSNENNEPIHVHIVKGKPSPNTTKVWLTRAGQCIVANNSSKIPQNDLNELLDVISAQFFMICQKWKEHFKVVFVKRKCEQKGPKKVSTFSTRFHVVSNVFPKYQMLTF